MGRPADETRACDPGGKRQLEATCLLELGSRRIPFELTLVREAGGWRLAEVVASGPRRRPRDSPRGNR